MSNKTFKPPPIDLHISRWKELMPKGDWLDNLSKWSNVLHLDPSSCLTVITEVHSCASHLPPCASPWGERYKIKKPIVAVAGRQYGHLDFHRSDCVISLFACFNRLFRWPCLPCQPRRRVFCAFTAIISAQKGIEPLLIGIIDFAAPPTLHRRHHT